MSALESLKRIKKNSTCDAYEILVKFYQNLTSGEFSTDLSTLLRSGARAFRDRWPPSTARPPEVAGLLHAVCSACTYLTAALWIAREARHAALKLKVPAKISLPNLVHVAYPA